MEYWLMGNRCSPCFRLWLMLLFGLPLAMIAYWMVVRMEDVDNTGLPTGLALYYHVVLILAALTLLNTLIARSFPHLAVLSRSELLCLYSMMAIASAFASWEAAGTLVPSLGYPAEYIYRSTPTMDWIRPVLKHLPYWAVVRDPRAAHAIFQGGPWSETWPGWLVPLVAWGLILSALLLIFLALTRLLYDPWAHHERLTFPLTELPLQMTDARAPLWRSRLFWLGAGLSGALDLLNGLHQLWPSLPGLNVKVIWLNQNPQGLAWQAVSQVPLTFHPLMLGLAFLLRTDLLFSTWFFYLLGKVQLYIAGAAGVAYGSPYAFGHNVPGLLAQNMGAVFVLGLGWVWAARKALLRRWMDAVHGDTGARTDYALLACGSGALLWVLVRLGLAPWAAVLSLFCMYMLALLVSRLRAELGLPVHNLQFQGPDGPMTAVFGKDMLGDRGLEAFGALYALTRSLQGHPMPHQMEAAYLQDQAGSLQSGFWWAVTLAGLLAAMAGPWIFLYLVSQHGLEPGGYNPIGEEGWRRLQSFLASPPSADPVSILQMIAGSLLTLGLLNLRHCWLESPFHPVGYAISGSWGTGMVWTPFLLAWIAKSLLLRYGGLKQYRAAVPFALGLVMGEFTMGSVWTVVSLITGAQTYRIWLF